MKYYLFRHGATRASTTDNVYHGEEIVTADILNSGKPAIKKMAKFLKDKKIDMYCTSPFKRCIQTMDLIKDEIDITYFMTSSNGLTAGVSSSPLANTTTSEDDISGSIHPLAYASGSLEIVIDDRLGEFREDKGESFEEFGLRIQSFLKGLELKELESVAICTHGAGLSALKHYIIDGDYKYEDLMDFPSSGILWKIEDKNLTEIGFNSKEKT